MRVRVDGKWRKDTKGIKDEKEYEVEIPRYKEIVDGVEYEYNSRTLKMNGQELKKVLEK